MGDCFICAKHETASGVVSDDGVVFVGHTLPVRGPDALLGYLMVEPRRHVAGLGHLSDEEAARLGVTVNRVAAAMRSALGLEHVYSFVFGDAVPHLHVNLAPRYPETPPEFRGPARPVSRTGSRDLGEQCRRSRSSARGSRQRFPAETGLFPRR